MHINTSLPQWDILSNNLSILALQVDIQVNHQIPLLHLKAHQAHTQANHLCKEVIQVIHLKVEPNQCILHNIPAHIHHKEANTHNNTNNNNTHHNIHLNSQDILQINIEISFNKYTFSGIIKKLYEIIDVNLWLFI